MSNIKHASIIVVTGRNYDKQGLLHLLDSQAAVAILRKGASTSIAIVPLLHCWLFVWI